MDVDEPDPQLKDSCVSRFPGDASPDGGFDFEQDSPAATVCQQVEPGAPTDAAKLRMQAGLSSSATPRAGANRVGLRAEPPRPAADRSGQRRPRAGSRRSCRSHC